jgi:hypothetical protein
MIWMFLKAIAGVALIAAGCVILVGGPTGGTLLMGIAALVLGGAILLNAGSTGGGRHR